MMHIHLYTVSYSKRSPIVHEAVVNRQYIFTERENPWEDIRFRKLFWLLAAQCALSKWFHRLGVDDLAQNMNATVAACHGRIRPYASGRLPVIAN
jgi:hypothetical protein